MNSTGLLWLVLLIYLNLGLVHSIVSCDGDCNGKLILTNVVFRHGDRAPSTFYPNDPHSNSVWPFGLSQLTNLGKQQHYHFGQWMRQRYGDILLPQKYNENDIYVRSTFVDRAIQSAYANLAGLYPPSDDQVWNEKIYWQPIPVHTFPNNQDYLLLLAAGTPDCPVFYQEYYSSKLIADIVKKLYDDNKDNVNYALSHAGYNTNDTAYNMLLNILTIREDLIIETIYKMTLPTWTKTINAPGKWMDDIYARLFTLSTVTDDLAQFHVGYFLKDVLDRCKSKEAGTLVPNYSAYFYSAHDINIVVVLAGLGMYDEKPIDYTAAILFEVRLIDNVAYLEIYYKRSSEDISPELMYIPGCGYSCKVTKMYKIYAAILPKKDLKTACELPKPQKN